MRYGQKRIYGELNFEIYNFACRTALEIFEEIAGASKNFPKEKVYLADLVCRHSRLVCVSLEEAWFMKEQGAGFIDKLSEAAQAASKTQIILKFASKYNYIDRKIYKKIDVRYEDIFEDLFEMLCDRKKMMNYPKNNFKREPGYREAVVAA